MMAGSPEETPGNGMCTRSGRNGSERGVQRVVHSGIRGVMHRNSGTAFDTRVPQGG